MKRPLWVAEYCLICRDVQPHRLAFQRDSQSRRPVHFVKCSVCSHQSETDATRYQATVHDLPPSILELVNQTFPRLPLVVAGRVAFEKEAIGQRLASPERLEAIREPFVVLGHLTSSGPGVGLFLFLSVVFGILSFIPTVLFTVLVNARHQETVLMVAGTIGFIAAVALAGVVVLRRRRHLGKRIIVPMISRSLRPLRPSKEELRDVLRWTATMGHPIAELFTVQELFDSVSRHPDRSLINADEMNLIEMARRMYSELDAAQNDAGLSTDSPPNRGDRLET